MAKTVVVLAAVSVIVGMPTAGAGDPVVKDRSGNAIRWGDWLADNGPAAVLIWASWSPGAPKALAGTRALLEACARKGLSLVIVDVQEEFEEALGALDPVQVDWVHDRHGALLKEYRVIKVPSLVVISSDGSVLGHLEATPEALDGWTR